MPHVSITNRISIVTLTNMVKPMNAAKAVNTREGYGCVIMAGGLAYDSNQTVSSTTAEKFDYHSEKFSDTGSLTDARFNHSMTLLDDGSILVAGGCENPQNNYLASIELYTNGEFSKLSAAMSHGRCAHSACLMTDGNVLIAGGWVKSKRGGRPEQTNIAEIFVSSDRKILNTSNMVLRRGSGVASVSLPSGEVLVVGGTSGVTAEIYTPITGNFSTLDEKLPVVMSSVEIVDIGNGKFLLIDTNLGVSVVFDSQTKSFRRTGNLIIPRAEATVTKIFGGNVLVAGGFDFSGDLQDVIALGVKSGRIQNIMECEIYDVSTGTFVIAGKLLHPRGGHTGTDLYGEGVLVAGGRNPETNEITTTASLIRPRMVQS